MRDHYFPELAPEPVTDIELEQALRTVYATALRHCHEGGSIAIHIGSEVRDYLKARLTHRESPGLPGFMTPRFFGYPLVVDEDAAPRSIAVHVVHFVL